ncbi:MAG: ABC transporter ATP-binding protein [Acidimicrobiia bacterium]
MTSATATGNANGSVMSGAVLEVRDLGVEFPTDAGLVKAVDGMTFHLDERETVALVGESGSGKSVTSLAILGLLPKRARVRGEVVFRGETLTGKSDKEMQPYRGNRISMIFQDALTALNPVLRVGDQIAEAITAHHKVEKSDLKARVVGLLELVGIPNPSTRADQYPHEFSGGMRQRAMIAMSIANEPDVLIADEPTTALDVTVQAQVLDTIRRIQERTNSAILLITHDLGVVAGLADRVIVMYAGRPVEIANIEDTFYATRHPYTQGLLASLPRLDTSGDGARKLHPIVGQPPSLIRLPRGCAFHPRCPIMETGVCDSVRPELRHVGAEHQSACHRAELLAGSADR